MIGLVIATSKPNERATSVVVWCKYGIATDRSEDHRSTMRFEAALAESRFDDANEHALKIDRLRGQLQRASLP